MKKILTSLLAIVAFHATATADDTNVLLIASTHPFGEVEGVAKYTEQDLVRYVSSRLMRELSQRGRVHVDFEDVYRQKKIDVAVGGGGQAWPNEFACHSLAQWYFWPEGHDARMAALTGQGETKYDYVVLAGDPYLIMNMPGIYAEGVNLIANKVKQGGAETVLLIPWGTRITKATRAMNEVVCRVGLSADLTVIPRTVAARSARDTQGVFESQNPFSMKHVDKRKITYHHTGTSSERGIEGGLRRAAEACNIDISKAQPQDGMKVDFNYGRANSTFEPDKRYKVKPEHYDRSYGFPMQDHSKTASETMLLGIDRRKDDGTDLGIALDMIQDDELKHDVRSVPIRLLWAKMQDVDPQIKPLRDRWHMSNELDSATGAFMITLLSGRCPVNDKPDEADANAMRHWLGQKIGYETAWRMNHLHARVPGFRVRPLDKNAELKTDTTRELQVKFHEPPAADVTVTVSLDQPAAATATPATLTFTPDNYNTAQTVTVTAKTVNQDTPFNVRFKTESKDQVFHSLSDSWGYTAKP